MKKNNVWMTTTAKAAMLLIAALAVACWTGCGRNNPSDTVQAVEPPSRSSSPASPRSLLAKAKAAEEDGNINFFGFYTGMPMEDAKKLATQYGLTGLQLKGLEKDGAIEALASEKLRLSPLLGLLDLDYETMFQENPETHEVYAMLFSMKDVQRITKGPNTFKGLLQVVVNQVGHLDFTGDTTWTYKTIDDVALFMNEQYALCLLCDFPRKDEAMRIKERLEQRKEERAQLKAFQTEIAAINKELRAGETRQPGETKMIALPGGARMEMVWCPPGAFLMGSPESEEGRDDDETLHQVTLTRGFWMAKTEVTQGQWKSLMGMTVADLARKGLEDDTLYDFGDEEETTLREQWGLERDDDPKKRCGDLDDDVPVYYLSWNEAREFCERMTARGHSEGWLPAEQRFRLPTEAEWEYACRAGTTAALPNGKELRILGECNAPALDDIAWYGGNSSVGFNGNRGCNTENWAEKQYPGGWASARKVGLKAPNAWGLHDMLGNVDEWCEDAEADYPAKPVEDYCKRNGSTALTVCRINRGGNWASDAWVCRSACRSVEPSGYRDNTVGFRPVLTTETTPKAEKKAPKPPKAETKEMPAMKEATPAPARDFSRGKKAPAAGDLLTPVRSLNSGIAGQTVRIRARVQEVKEPAEGSKKPTELVVYDEAGDRLVVKYWESAARVMKEKPVPGSLYDFEGTVDIYRSRPALKVESGYKIRLVSDVPPSAGNF